MDENERSDGLFDMARRELKVGDMVQLSTIFGAERAKVVELGVIDSEGWPMIKVEAQASGDTVTCSASRVTVLSGE